MWALRPGKETGKTEHAKENKAFRFVVVKDDENGGWIGKSERGRSQRKGGNWIDGGVWGKLRP